MKHNFIETTDGFGEFQRVIYCTWCGLVVWDFNQREVSVKALQGKVGNCCVYEEPSNGA